MFIIRTKWRFSLKLELKKFLEIIPHWHSTKRYHDHHWNLSCSQIGKPSNMKMIFRTCMEPVLETHCKFLFLNQPKNTQLQGTFYCKKFTHTVLFTKLVLLRTCDGEKVMFLRERNQDFTQFLLLRIIHLSVWNSSSPWEINFYLFCFFILFLSK